MTKACLKKTIFLIIILPALLFLNLLVPTNLHAYAEDVQTGPMVAFMMSPMTERLTLSPGDKHKGSFYIMNPEQNTALVRYGIKIQSFYRDDESNAIFEDVDGRGQIAKWITLDVPDTGTLLPGDSTEIFYTIDVPKDAPGGGQYAAITATSLSTDEGKPNATNLKETIAMAHTIFAEINGQTVRSAEIYNVSVPGFLFDGNISVSSIVANTGNVHGTATYTLEVYPLFSNDPLYSNEDNPEKKLILPDRTLMHESTWEQTPSLGIFNIYYKVEFEGGAVKEIRKLLIKCPVWLIFVIIFVIVALVILIISKAKLRKAHIRGSQD